MTRLLALAAALVAAGSAQAGDCLCDEPTPRVSVENGTLSLAIGDEARHVVVDPAAAPVVVERVFALDTGTGSVRFGDGLRGSVPPTGTSVTSSYRTGTGGGGSVVRDGADLSATVVTARPALVTLPPAASDDEDDQDGGGEGSK